MSKKHIHFTQDTPQQQFIDFVMQQDPDTTVSHQMYNTCYIGFYLKEHLQHDVSNEYGVNWAQTNLVPAIRAKIGDLASPAALAQFNSFKDLQTFLVDNHYTD